MQNISKRILRLPLYRFGSGAHHDNHAPTLNQDQTWIEKPQFLGIQGFKDLHDHEHIDDSDPYAHLAGKSLLSFERLYFSDAYYHEDAHEPLMNNPHGYMTNDDPFDYRTGMDESGIELIFVCSILVTFGLFYGVHGHEYRNLGEKLLEDSLTANLLEDKIREIRIENQKLEQRRDFLRQQLGK